MKLNQLEGRVSGTAFSGTTQGKVLAYVAGDHFEAKVTWAATLVTKKETVSNYSGTINQEGIIEGTMNPGDSAWRSESFSSLTAMKRLRTDSQDSSKSPGPLGPGAPRIAARPSTVVIPAGQTQATTTLMWDGGSAHPYAEVWVKVGDQDETKVVEQGKGYRRVTVEAGKTYLYLLEDADRTLATCTVKGK